MFPKGKIFEIEIVNVVYLFMFIFGFNNIDAMFKVFAKRSYSLIPVIGLIGVNLLASLSGYTQTKSEHTISNYKEIPSSSGIVFRVQIMYSNTPLPANYFKNVKGVMEDISSESAFKYVVGSFTYFESANVCKLKMVELGYLEANVVAYKDGERILVDDARDIVEKAFVLPKVDRKDKKTPKDTVPEVQKVITDTFTHHSEILETAPNKNNSIVELRIQLITTKKRLPVTYERFNGIHDVYVEQGNDGYYRYFYGKYSSVKKVAKVAEVMQKKGFKTAFIAAYKGHKRISLTEAALALESQPAPDTLVDESPTFIENHLNENEIIESNENMQIKKVEFRVQIAANSTTTPDEYYWLNEIDSIYYERGQDGYYRYFVGSFNSFDKAWELKEKLKKNGFMGVFVAAFSDGKKITIEEGLKIIEKQ